MPDLNFDSFQRFMAESHTEEGRERQEEDSMRSLIQHGRAYDLAVDDDTEGQEASAPQSHQRAGRQDGAARDNDAPPTAKTASTVTERWEALKQEHGTCGQKR